jgi:glyoxylase-like metal-dependent hydrolase (beta-lactamase superfamily II)
VELRIVSGHTPGQIIPVVDLGNRKLVFAADLIPSAAHIPLLWNMSYDIDQLLTISEKSALLNEALAGNYVLMFQHDLTKLEGVQMQIAVGHRAQMTRLPKGIK